MGRVLYQITPRLTKFVHNKRIEARMTQEAFCAGQDESAGDDIGRTLRDILRGKRSNAQPVRLTSQTILAIAKRFQTSVDEIEGMCVTLVDGKRHAPAVSKQRAVRASEEGASTRAAARRRVVRPAARIPKKIVGIAMLLNGNVQYAEAIRQGFMKRLEELLEKTRFCPRFEQYSYEPRHDGLSNIKRWMDTEFSRVVPEYFLPIGTQPTLAALELASKTKYASVPIVFVGVTDPVRSGIVPSMKADPARGSISGVTFGLNTELRMRFLAGIFHGRKIGFIYSDEHPQDRLVCEEIQRLCHEGKFSSSQFPCIHTKRTSLTASEEDSADAFFGYFHLNKYFSTFSGRAKKPMIGVNLGDVRRDAIVAIGHESSELGEIAAEQIVFRHLTRGVALSDIDIVDPHATRFAINMRIVKERGLTISEEALDMADVVE